MKVYQMIYTSVMHSLSDESLGLINRPGQRVYSCSEGLTRENIAELMRFSSYRLPKNNTVKYSEEYADPTVPTMFPKTFRTLRLADGRFAAIQSVYSGYDINGDEGNFFAHALVFDECPDEFFPEMFFGSELFRTSLTKAEQEAEIVRYLPIIENPEPPEETISEVKTFIKLHRKELTYLVNHAVTMLTSENLKNICISTDDEYLTERYLVSLKWILPRDVSRNTGISTYNVYMPSDKQDRIVFHGTIDGKNNITREAIDSREHCIYIDMNSIDFSAVAVSNLFNMSVEELRLEYEKYNIQSISAFLDWFALTQNTNCQGMGGKLLKFKHSAGDAAFALRARELFEKIDDEDMADVKFEITKVMYDNIDLFDKEASKITEIYVTDCITKLCHGETYDVESIFRESKQFEGQSQAIAKNLTMYMDMIYNHADSMGDKNRRIVIDFIAYLKHITNSTSWFEFFKGKKKHISIFVELAAPVVVTGAGTGSGIFVLPKGWLPEEMHELIAYIESSTEDRTLSMGCIKFITEHEDVDWERYGITIAKRKKMLPEIEEDSAKIKRLLTKVGYEPFQRHKYTDVKSEVMYDMEENRSPLLVSRLLYAFYTWQGMYGNQRDAKEWAEKIQRMLIELRAKEPQCYNYMISKLGIEIVESPGHYHELIINTNTVPDSFWNWFLIGFKAAARDDKKMLSYMRIYEANKMKLMKLPIKSELREAFSKESN